MPKTNVKPTGQNERAERAWIEWWSRNGCVIGICENPCQNAFKAGFAQALIAPKPHYWVDFEKGSICVACHQMIPTGAAKPSTDCDGSALEKLMPPTLAESKPKNPPKEQP